MRILLDMDCVLADFMAGVAHVYGVDKAAVEAEWTPGEYGVNAPLARAAFRHNNRGEEPPAGLTMDDSELWWPIGATAGFWRDLPKLPWADDLVRLVREAAGDDWYVVSHPSRCAGCVREKEHWLAAYFGLAHDRLVPTPHKHLLANPKTVLIDDHEENCDSFAAAGGYAVLFPALHNRRHHWRTDPLVKVAAALAGAAGYVGLGARC